MKRKEPPLSAEEKSRRQRQRREDKRNDKKCTYCGSSALFKNYVKCEPCFVRDTAKRVARREKDSELNKIRNDALLEKDTCTKCRKNKIEDGKQTCKSCSDSAALRARNIKDKRIEFLFSKLGSVCVDCGESNRWMLSFDHEDPTKKTKKNIGVMNLSMKVLKTEYVLLKTRCRCCHAKKSRLVDHYGLNKCTTTKGKNLTARRVENAKKFTDYKMQQGCCWPGGCNYKIEVPDQLHFDHEDASTKSFSISEKVRNQNFDEKKILAEIKKCKVLCANHHGVRTTLQLHKYCVWKDGLPPGDLEKFINERRSVIH